MKTTAKNKALSLLILVISTLLFADCRIKTKVTTRDLHENIIQSFAVSDVYDTLMLLKVQKEVGNILKDDFPDIKFKYTSLEEKYSALLCECYSESEHVLDLTLKSNSRDCFDAPVGYQQFRLSRYKSETMDGKVFHFYTFATIKKDIKKDKIDERIQNFYLSKGYEISDFSIPVLFVKRYNYDFFNREKTSPVKYEFKMEVMPSDNAFCLTKILNRDFNMIGGSKSLVYDIMKSFDTRGILLKQQDTAGIKLVVR